jgi:hypothetical protein
MPRVRLADDIQVPVMPLPALPSNNLSPSSGQPTHSCLQPGFLLTLQCSHRFLIALCTFIPLVCCCTATATDPAVELVTAIGARATRGWKSAPTARRGASAIVRRDSVVKRDAILDLWRTAHGVELGTRKRVYRGLVVTRLRFRASWRVRGRIFSLIHLRFHPKPARPSRDRLQQPHIVR